MKKIFLLITFLLTSKLILSQQGATWVEQTSGVTVPLTSVSITGFTNAWVCGENGTVLRTQNAGVNWANVSSGIPNTRDLVNIFGIDANNALTAGYEGTNTYVYRTTNAGTNWTQVFFQANGFIDAIWMISPQNGFMVGDPILAGPGSRWSLWKTTNSGASWDSAGLFLPITSAIDQGWPNSLFISPPNRIWFGTNNSKIYHSSNYGSNWIEQSISPKASAFSLIFDGISTGLAGSNSILKTTNNGTNWFIQPSPGNGSVSGITFNNLISDNQFFLRTWCTCNDSMIYYSSNEGSSWVIEYSAPAGRYSYLSKPFISIYIFAIRNNGGISRGAVNIGGGIAPVANEIPNGFYLSQNHPNPFNPTTAFKFSVPKKSQVVLKIYNSLGAEIETLVNQELPPAVYEASWETSKYSSGVYYYRLTADSYTQTRKMVLIK